MYQGVSYIKVEPEPCRVLECKCYDSERGSVWIPRGLCGQVCEVTTVSAFCLFIPPREWTASSVKYVATIWYSGVVLSINK